MLDITGNNVLIVTSNDVEKTALQNALNEQGVKLIRTHQSLSNRLKVGVLSGYPLVTLSAERGAFKPNSVGVLIPEILVALKPQLVILVGFSYGKPGAVNLHDVVVSREIVSLVDLKGTDSGVDFRSFPKVASDLTPETVASLVNDAAGPAVNAVMNKGLRTELRVGPIFSGEVLAEGQAFTERLYSELPEALGGDMEGHAVATHCARQKVSWLIVKSPSDFGVGTAGTTNAQGFSAMTSATAATELIKAFVSQKPLRCPEGLLSALSAEIASPHEWLSVKSNLDYPSRIKKFISRFSLEAPYDKDFQDHLVGVIKEIAENAAKHPEEPEVGLRSDKNGVVIEYGGKPFNPKEEFAKMAKAGGGKFEFDSFVATYGTEKPIVTIEWNYVGGRNHFAIRFSETSADLRRTFACTLSLDKHELANYCFQTDRSISELATCDTVWLDLRDVTLSYSDNFLLSVLIRKIPKTVNHIRVRGCPQRLMSAFVEEFRSDTRVQFA
jgi:nucleoside phosphorylase